jgi:hypothetical protein
VTVGKWVERAGIDGNQGHENLSVGHSIVGLE